MSTTSAVALCLAVVVVPATAQIMFTPAPIICLDAKKIVSNLDKAHHELLLVRGVTAQGQLFEVHSSSQGDTWTALLILPQGLACPIAAGDKLVVPSLHAKGQPT